MIVSDHQVMSAGLRMRFGRTPDMEVICEALNGREAVRCCELYRPDATLIDWELSGSEGPCALRELRRRFPEMPIVVLTTYAQTIASMPDGERYRGIAEVLKSSSIEWIVTAVRDAVGM